jgi:hypothetical protein
MFTRHTQSLLEGCGFPLLNFANPVVERVVTSLDVIVDCGVATLLPTALAPK